MAEVSSGVDFAKLGLLVRRDRD